MNIRSLKGPLRNSTTFLTRYLSSHSTSCFVASSNLNQNILKSNKHIYLNTKLFQSTYIEKGSFTNSKFNNLRNNIIGSKMPPVQPTAEKSVEEFVEKSIKENGIVIFSKTTCPFCVKAKEMIKGLTSSTITYITLDTLDNGKEIQDYLATKTGQRTVPNIFLQSQHIGGFDNLSKLNKESRLQPLLVSPDSQASVSTDLKPKAHETIEQFCNNLIRDNKVMIFSKDNCPFAAKVKELFNSINQKFTAIELDKMDEGSSIRDYLFGKTGQKTFPNVYVNGQHLGGSDSCLAAHADGRLAKLLDEKKDVLVDEGTYDYDLVVIGGGSGGLACSKTAAMLGAKVLCLDFVPPTPIGSTWGLGGTCVNVGCIPKKLMHQSALLGEALKDSKEFGWKTPDNIQHDWETMKNAIQDYIGSLNWGYRVQLRDKKVEYINALGEFVDSHKLLLTPKNKKTKEVTARNIVVAVGGRPKYPDIIGAKEHTITSDDLFSLSYNPGKTLCVGASYVSLECAGFLKGIGNDVTVMVRSILLRGFDQQMANIIGDYMEKHGINFIRDSVPTEIVQVKAPEEGKSAGEYIVKYVDGKGVVSEETYNTVLLAVGREAGTDCLNLDKAGVKVNPKNKKIWTNFEQSNIDHIYAVGDVVDESSANGAALELTPVAIQAGQLLARRLFGNSDVKMDYYSVPTTVFTPLEYGAIGYSEEDAIKKFGEDNIEVYHQNFWPLEWTVAHRPNDVCYAKLICNKADQERVVGLHVCGPNAGEITQGYGVAMKLRATKRDFDVTVGIHPTCSETFTTMNTTKASGDSVIGSGC